MIEKLCNDNMLVIQAQDFIVPVPLTSKMTMSNVSSPKELITIIKDITKTINDINDTINDIDNIINVTNDIIK